MTATEAFARRAERAGVLAREGGPGASLLSFASALLSAQGAFAEEVSREHARAPFGGSPVAGLARLTRARKEFLDALRSSPAPEVAQEAERRWHETEDGSVRRLAAAFEARTTGWDGFLTRALLRPYLEALRTAGLAPVRPNGGTACSWCDGPPAIGFLRSPEPSEGAKRHLVCAACGLESQLERIRCAGCTEGNPKKLPVFRSERHAGVRLEACATCRRYVKTIDLNVDARPIPEVDDLVSVAMDLWASEEGWRRLEPGLAGI